jgi:serine protease Do
MTPKAIFREAKAAVIAAMVLPLLLLGSGATMADDMPASFANIVEKVCPAVVNISITALIDDPVAEQAANDAGGAAPSQPAPSPSASLQKSVSGTPDIAKNMPAMPNAMNGTPMERLFREHMRARHVKLVGSGFIIDRSGLIVTNNHVVARAAVLDVTLADGTILPARVVGADEFSDIAILRVDPPHPLPVVTWAPSAGLRPGDWVIAIGNPFGLGTSISAGVFSARGRDIGADPYDDFLQINVAINPGNSGGPLFDTKGRVVGINTATEAPNGGSVGIGFSIPSEFALSVINTLRTQHHIERGWLGIRFTGNPLAPQDDGVEIDGLQVGGPGVMGGLRVHDRVLAINGAEMDTPRDIVRAIAALPPGSIVAVTVRRKGQDIELPVTVGRRPELGGG